MIITNPSITQVYNKENIKSYDRHSVADSPDKGSVKSWWCHGMEMLSVLLALCEGNPLVTGGFPSQRASNAQLWSFLFCKLEQAVEQTMELTVICDAMMLI